MLMELKAVGQRNLAVLEVISGVPVTDVAERYGVSRQGGLVDRSHRSNRHSKQIPPEIEALVGDVARDRARYGYRPVVDTVPAAGLLESDDPDVRAYLLLGALTEAATVIGHSDESEATRVRMATSLNRLIDGLRPHR